jgi:FkbM family methyltransferase
MRAHAGRWRARYETLRRRSRERSAREEQRRAALKAEASARIRQTPSVHVMRDALQIRTPAAQRHAAEPSAQARHERFAAASPAYARALATSATLEEEARRLSIDGLTWWLPAPRTRSAAAIERLALKQRIPYRGIALSRDLAVGRVMIDIGANIGRMAVPRVVLGDFDVVYCAEPDALNYRCLVANVVANGLQGLVLPDQLAISDRGGTVTLRRGKAPGAHRVLHESSNDPAVAVPSMTLDAWVERSGIDLTETTFVKVDTQGSEVHVLSGASRVLSYRHIAWQIEVAPWLLRLAGTSPAALYGLMQEHFTHFVDLNSEAQGPRRRPIEMLVEALAYLDRDEEAHTDVLLYRAVR